MAAIVGRSDVEKVPVGGLCHCCCPHLPSRSKRKSFSSVDNKECFFWILPFESFLGCFTRAKCDAEPLAQWCQKQCPSPSHIPCMIEACCNNHRSPDSWNFGWCSDHCGHHSVMNWGEPHVWKCQLWRQQVLSPSSQQKDMWVPAGRLGDQRQRQLPKLHMSQQRAWITWPWCRWTWFYDLGVQLSQFIKLFLNARFNENTWKRSLQRFTKWLSPTQTAAQQRCKPKHPLLSFNCLQFLITAEHSEESYSVFFFCCELLCLLCLPFSKLIS